MKHVGGGRMTPQDCHIVHLDVHDKPEVKLNSMVNMVILQEVQTTSRKVEMKWNFIFTFQKAKVTYNTTS